MTRSGGVCAVCGGSLYQYSTPQYAHAIANTKENRLKYGRFFIDHFLNGAMVCSLACNDAVNIGHNNGLVLDKLAEIIIFEIKTGGFINGDD